jgi:hypothetical protein
LVEVEVEVDGVLVADEHSTAGAVVEIFHVEADARAMVAMAALQGDSRIA